MFVGAHCFTTKDPSFRDLILQLNKCCNSKPEVRVITTFKQFDLLALELQLRELLGVQEVGARDVRVTALVVGVEAACRDRDLNRRVGFAPSVVAE